MDYKFTFEDGSEAIYHSDLYHGDHKYIRKFMENGKWVYEYAKDAAKKAASGAKWLGQAVKNDLNGTTNRLQSRVDEQQKVLNNDREKYDSARKYSVEKRHEAERAEEAARNADASGNRISRDFRRNDATILRQELGVASSKANTAKRITEQDEALMDVYRHKRDSSPSLKRKISELLNKKKKK